MNPSPTVDPKACRTPGDATVRDRTPERNLLIAGVLDEMTAFTPSKLMRAMRQWPQGPVSLIHVHVLSTLEIDGPLSMRELADSIGVSQASVTGIVDRMVERGLVGRRRDESDRRVIHVELSQAGHDMITGMADERRERLAGLLDQLTDEELTGYLAGSRALRLARERLLDRYPDTQRSR